MNSQIFKNFSEFWFYTKSLSDSQRQTILRSMSKQEQKRLESSYKQGGWEDFFMRNRADKNLNDIKSEFYLDLIDLRIKILKKKKVQIRKSFWEFINDKFKGFSTHHTYYIFGGYRAVEDEYESEWFNLIPSEG